MDLRDEAEINKDLLVLDFKESLYTLPFKDIGFLKFIQSSCSSVDYVFKGDDDILLLPQNLKTELDELINSDFEAIGCLRKPNTPPIRKLSSKYFIPKQVYPGSAYPAYFSGLAYLTTGNFSMKMADAIPHVPVLPYDDVYVGSLIAASNQTEKLTTSISICCGVWASSAIYKNDMCSLQGLTVAHKITNYRKMEKTYNHLISRIGRNAHKPGLRKLNSNHN